MKWVTPNVVTVKNMLGKRHGLLAEGDCGRAQSPVMETQTLHMAYAMCHNLSCLTACPLPSLSPLTAPSAFLPQGLCTGCSSVDSPAQAPSVCVTEFLTTPNTLGLVHECLLSGARGRCYLGPSS